MKKQQNKRNKQKKMYRQNRKKQSKEKQGKQTMRMSTAGRKSIACWPKTNMEGGVESTSRGDAIKDRQRMVGGKASVDEIGGAFKTGG